MGEVEHQPHRLGEIAVAIGEHQDAVADPARLAPGFHHEDVVDRHAGDGVDPFGLDLGSTGDKTWQVGVGAGGGERAGDGEEHHLLAREDLVGGQLFDALGGLGAEFGGRNLVINLDRHGSLLGCRDVGWPAGTTAETPGDLIGKPADRGSRQPGFLCRMTPTQGGSLSHTHLYPEHLAALDRFLTDALERAGRKGLGLDGVIFHSGRARTYHADDRPIELRPAAHFRRWVPALDGPEHVVLARPGRRPRVVRVHPTDYWYDTSPPAPSYWEDHVELIQVASFESVREHLGPTARLAYVGDSPQAAGELGIIAEHVEPAALMAPLDWHRATKTPFEVALLEHAAKKGAAGHRGAREVFEAGGTEREVHWAFLESTEQLERELPYETIVAFNAKAAILHYQHKRGPEVAPGQVLLLDAGAAEEGYACDVTRTWVADGIDDVFKSLLHGVDRLERRLVAAVSAGRPYLEIHVEAHRATAELLAASGLVKVSAEEAFESGLTRSFLPHGVGHQLGLQVHDVGGHQTGPEGGKTPPPAEYPFLRNTRTLEPGHVVTIEPGLYFIPLLLDPLRASEAGKAVDWALVDRLAPCGGIRIEDNVVCTESGPRDLTRPFLEGPRGV